jgi:hypothetical protein
MIRSIEFHQWQANLRVLELAEIKTVLYVPLSHPLVERLIGEFGRATELFTISTEARAGIQSVMGFDVSADGNRFVILMSPTGPLPVVIQNWEALLP